MADVLITQDPLIAVGSIEGNDDIVNLLVWPTALPQKMILAGFQESPPDVILRTKMDAGPDKARPLYSDSFRGVVGAIDISLDRKSIAEDFYNINLQGGNLDFDWIHPVFGSPASFKFEEPPQYVLVEGTGYIMSMKLRINP